MSEKYPTSVLSEALSEAIKGRRVKAAVFTTFSFDPGFFDLHVLPSLFDYPFHHADKVKKLQLEDVTLPDTHPDVVSKLTAMGNQAPYTPKAPKAKAGQELPVSPTSFPFD